MAVLVETKITGSVSPELEKALKRIEKLEKQKIKIKLETNGSELKQVTKEQEKQNKLILQRLDLEKKMVVAVREGHKKSESQLNILFRMNEQGKLYNQEHVKLLARIKEEDKSYMKLNARKVKMYKDITNERMKNQAFIEKAHSDALKMDANYTTKKIKQNQDAYNKMYTDASKINKKMDTDKRSLDKQYERFKLSLISSGLDKRYSKRLKSIKKGNKIEKTEFLKLQKDVSRKMAEKRGAKLGFSESYSSLLVLQQFGNTIGRGLGEITQFEDSLYQMGIVAGKSVLEIRSMRTEMHDLGSVIPRATNEIVSQITEIERTGRTYKEAVGIITGASKLAVASGESLADSVKLSNITLKAFDIQVINSAKALDSLHSATINTPLDLKKISSAMKNAGASMRNFIESTSKSGTELEDYKQQILDLSLALVGGQVNLGRTANSAGVSVRINNLMSSINSVNCGELSLGFQYQANIGNLLVA